MDDEIQEELRLVQLLLGTQGSKGPGSRARLSQSL